MQRSRHKGRLWALVLLSGVALGLLSLGCSLNGDDEREGALVETLDERSDAKEPPCEGDFREVERLGVACRLEDGPGWKVRLDDGATVTTHGHDPRQVVASLEGVPQKGNFRGTLCTNQNPRGNYHFLAILARPAGVAPKATAADLQLKIWEANHAVHGAAVESGSPGADLVFACDGNGFLRVDVVQLALQQSATTFGGIVSELRTKGYDKPNEKYVIWYDSTLPGGWSWICGEATGYISASSIAAETNPNNSGPSYAISYSCESLLHELAHTIGAVQRNAPHPGYYHCWDEEDVMCYDDGYLAPPGQKLVTSCQKPDRFDCNHDDYFDAAIGAGQGKGPGSYLDTNWNLGACYVRYVANYNSACRWIAPSTIIKINPQYTIRRGYVQITGVTSAESRATEFLVYRDNHPVGRFNGETGTELEFVDEDKLVPGETYEYRIVGLDAEGEFDSNSNVEQVTLPD